MNEREIVTALCQIADLPPTEQRRAIFELVGEIRATHSTLRDWLGRFLAVEVAFARAWKHRHVKVITKVRYVEVPAKLPRALKRAAERAAQAQAEDEDEQSKARAFFADLEAQQLASLAESRRAAGIEPSNSNAPRNRVVKSRPRSSKAKRGK